MHGRNLGKLAFGIHRPVRRFPSVYMKLPRCSVVWPGGQIPSGLSEKKAASGPILGLHKRAERREGASQAMQPVGRKM